MSIEQVNVTRNQSTLKVTLSQMFLFDNRYEEGNYKNNTGGVVVLAPFSLVARNIGTKETASVAFDAANITAGQTVTFAGLTYTSDGVTTQAQIAAAFAGLADGAVTGQQTALGVYSGKLVGYSTGPVTGGDTVLFTSSVAGDVADLVQTGDGAASVITIVAGTAIIADGLIPITADNLADVIGVSANVEDISQLAAAIDLINYAVSGTLNEELLILPGGVTLDTLAGNKVLRDVLEGLGFHLEKSIENTKFDNV